MIKKIIILGSTGSIGKTLVDIIKKNKNKFKVLLLTTNKNYKLLFKQAEDLNVKNLIIRDIEIYNMVIKKKLNKNFKIFNDFNSFKNIIRTKVDYTMSSITGLPGLEPTLKIIKYTKKIAIANKEAIICGWELIDKKLSKYKTTFIPIDSEHYSVWFAIKNNEDKVDKVYLTASGGPFYKLPLKKFKHVSIQDALKHPNWKMGKKISIDSATMMNKIFEIIEAKNLFNLSLKKLQIIIHPKSYIHSIIKYDNGMIKLIAHETSMQIPIANSLNTNLKIPLYFKNVNINILNNLKLNQIDLRRYPIVKILNKIPDKSSLFDTVIVSANDELVNLFLNNKIQFVDIYKKLFRLINSKYFLKYKNVKVKKLSEIIELDKYVRSVVNS